MNVSVYVDSPLAVSATSVFKNNNGFVFSEEIQNFILKRR